MMYVEVPEVIRAESGKWHCEKCGGIMDWIEPSSIKPLRRYDKETGAPIYGNDTWYIRCRARTFWGRPLRDHDCIMITLDPEGKMIASREGPWTPGGT